MGRQYSELMSFDFQSGDYTYQVEAYVNVHEVHAGTYSRTAEDPDEYFGVYNYELDYIEEVFVKTEDEDLGYLTDDEIADQEWLIDAIAEELYQ